MAVGLVSATFQLTVSVPDVYADRLSFLLGRGLDTIVASAIGKHIGLDGTWIDVAVAADPTGGRVTTWTGAFGHPLGED